MPTSDLQSWLSLKACVSARHCGAQGLVILKTEPVPEAFGILGLQQPASHSKLQLCGAVYHLYKIAAAAVVITVPACTPMPAHLDRHCTVFTHLMNSMVLTSGEVTGLS